MNFSNDVIAFADEREKSTLNQNTQQLNSRVRALSVSEFVTITDNCLANLGVASVEGEISEIRQYNHIYFKIKDEQSSVECLMWQSTAANLTFTPKVGDKVLITGKSSLYKKTGQFKLIAHRMEQVGLGVIMERLRLLKEKLLKEGVFNIHKREIPQFINTVGVITSAEGRVLHDIQTTMEMRNDGVNIILYNASVQGTDAPRSLREALALANSQNLCDVLIIGRGGGSFEDLLPFSDEALVRDIANSGIPIISAVGHEPDVSLSDFAADVRAATPTAAATLVTSITKAQLYSFIHDKAMKIDALIGSIYDEKAFYLDSLIKRLNSASPSVYIDKNRALIEYLVKEIDHNLDAKIDSLKVKLLSLRQKLIANEPQAYLSKKELLLNNLVSRLQRAVDEKMAETTNRLNYANTLNRLANALSDCINSKAVRLHNCVLRLQKSDIENQFISLAKVFDSQCVKLEALNPVAILKRGYSITFDNDKKAVSIDNLKIGDEVTTLVDKGRFVSKVISISKDKQNEA